MYIILRWSYIGDLTVVKDSDDMPRVFQEKEEAREYAEKNVSLNWKIIDFHEEEEWYVILNWSCPEDAAIVSTQVGVPNVFEREKEAKAYAKKELNFNWKVVRLEE
jgi:hypothetical protein